LFIRASPARRADVRFVGLVAGLPILLGIAQLLPHTGIGLAIRLAAATGCVLIVPGALIMRLTGWPRELGVAVGASVGWSLAAIFVCLLLTFAFAGSLTLTLVLLAALVLGTAVPVAVRRVAEVEQRDVLVVGVLALAGVGFAVAVWLATGPVSGDGLFHLARVRKLLDFPDLSLSAVNEFKHGGLHPGYAVPLWHAALGLITKLAGSDPTQTVRNVSALLVPLAFVVSYAAGRALFRSVWGGIAGLVAQFALIGLAPEHTGTLRSLSQPGVAARQILVPALLALVFTYTREKRVALLGAMGAGALALALIHPTYAVFLCVPLVGFLIARLLMAGGDVKALSASVVTLLVPSAAVAFFLLPIVKKTASYDASTHDLHRSLAKYPGQIDFYSDHSYRLAPELFSRSGAVAVAGLVCIPLAALAARRRWSAFVLGGSLAIFAVTLIPFIFPRFADAVSLSQARREGGFLPFAFALAGGAAVLAGLLRWAVLPVAVGAGIALQLAFPGDFGYRFTTGGPALATWIAAIGGALALAVVTTFHRRWSIERQGPLALAAVVLFCAPLAVNGFANLERGKTRGEPYLTAGVIQALRDNVPKQDIVFSDDATAYRIGAYAPVYVNAGPPSHVADTTDNFPYKRRKDAHRFFRTGNLSIVRHYGAHWIVLDEQRYPKLRLALPIVYRDDRYALYRF
jgi:hypothetical protein